MTRLTRRLLVTRVPVQHRGPQVTDPAANRVPTGQDAGAEPDAGWHTEPREVPHELLVLWRRQLGSSPTEVPPIGPARLCGEWPVGEKSLGLSHDRCQDRLEVFSVDLARPQNPTHGGPDRSFDVVAVGFGPVHLYRALDGLDDVVDQAPQEVNAIHGLALGGNGVVKRQLIRLQAELSGPLVGRVHLSADLDHRFDHCRRVDEPVMVAL